MSRERALYPRREYGYPIVVALSPADHQPPALDVEILDPQSQQLHQPQSRPISQLSHQTRGAFEFLKQPFAFIAAQHHGHPPFWISPLEDDWTKLSVQPFLQKKHECVQRLLLGRWTRPLPHG